MQSEGHEAADLVWEAVIYPVQEQYRQCSVVGRNMRLEAPGKEGWRAHVLWWLQSQKGMWGRSFSKGDMRSDLHSRKIISGQPGTEAWWLRGQLRGHFFFFFYNFKCNDPGIWMCLECSELYHKLVLRVSQAFLCSVLCRSRGLWEFSSQHPLARHVAVHLQRSSYVFPF